MKVLTIKQPWAGCIFRLGKDVENRSWATTHRGALYVHASTKLHSTDKAIVSPLDHDDTAWAAGAIIGHVQLVDIVRRSGSQWAMRGCWHWLLRDPVLLSHPVHRAGRSGLWNASEEIEMCEPDSESKHDSVVVG